MLTKEENELLCRVGPGTPMGDLMRQYWTPALLSSELAGPDCTPIRVKLLGEELIAFRDSDGRVGLVGNHCPHRGASLFFGRNEENGLRCVYHGWKYDVTGACVDMPSEPPVGARPASPQGRAPEERAGQAQPLQTRVRATAYPCRERGGVVWAYLGPRSQPPPLPDLEPNMLPEGQWNLSATMRECNYFQAMEGDIDTCHSPFLHSGTERVEDTRPGTFQRYRVLTKAPRYAVVDTDFGTMYGAHIPGDDDQEYWRVACFLFPFYVIIPSGLLGHQVLFRAWVPIDDTHTMFIYMSKRGEEQAERDGHPNQRQRYLEPNTTDWYGRFRLRPDASNDYFIDREKQRTRASFTGIEGVPIQDKAVTESMGPIFDRDAEHLASSDAMIIRTRHRMLAAARALRENGAVPPGVDDPAVYRVRGGGVILPKDVDWLAATEHLRRAFVEHPGLAPARFGVDRVLA